MPTVTFAKCTQRLMAQKVLTSALVRLVHRALEKETTFSSDRPARRRTTLDRY